LRLERVKGRKSKALKDMYDEPLILEFKDGQIYGGNFDEYEEGVIWLYNCKRLDKESHEWKNHGITTEIEGKTIEDPMPGFYLSDVKNIYVIPSDCTDYYAMEDVMQFYVNPHYKPLQGIRCHGGLEKAHTTECDAQLHDALTLLFTNSLYSSERQDMGEKEGKLQEALSCIRRRLLMYGAKIP
jgi:hypothetical protein